MCYDWLSRLVFGGKLTDAQRYLLTVLIKPGMRVLVAGGGSGEIVEEISTLQPSGLIIDYAEASSVMLAKARKRNAGKNEVNYIHNRVEKIAFGARKYDAILTPFLFDNFTDATARKVFSVMDAVLKPDGLWLYCDFRHTDNRRHKWLLKTMYAFFRICCNVEAAKLPDMDDCFLSYYYHPVMEATFMDGFILSAVYKRV